MQASPASASTREMQKLSRFGPWRQCDIQYCRLNNYDLTYTFYSKFPSWDFLLAHLWSSKASLSPVQSISLISSSVTLPLFVCFAFVLNYSPLVAFMATLLLVQWKCQNAYIHRYRKMYYMWYEKISWERASCEFNPLANGYVVCPHSCSYLVKFGLELIVASLCLIRWHLHVGKVVSHIHEPVPFQPSW